MFMQIITHTPVWVWVFLAGFIALGWSQARDREVSLKRVTLLPLVMITYSASSVLQNVGSHPSLFLAWLAACAIVAVGVMGIELDKKTRYQAETKMLTVAGSWVPMCLILTIFIGKYVLAIFSVMRADIAQSIAFTTASATIFGALSGIFLGRAARLWKLVAATKAPLGIQAA